MFIYINCAVVQIAENINITVIYDDENVETATCGILPMYDYVCFKMTFYITNTVLQSCIALLQCLPV